MNTEQARFNMIEQQIRPWEVLDPRVLNALQNVPREDFVPDQYRDLAFVDMNIRLDHDQVMMQPNLEARLLQELAPTTSDLVLEIGTGSGYMTALLASLAGRVESVDIFPDFIESAREKLAAHDFTNLVLRDGDAARGWSGEAPYDAIILTGSLPTLPSAFAENLAPGGRLIAVIGQDPIMEALLTIRRPDGMLSCESLFDTSIAPLLNAELPAAFSF
jgi:protein-L-isoaspartate(D-aspartate) O-methyltransferase